MEKSAFCYRVGDYQIMLEAGLRSELLSHDTVYPVPYSPGWFAGLASSRGDLFPVIDMHRVLLGQHRPAKQYLLSLQHEAFATVLVSCDELPRQIVVPPPADRVDRPSGLPGWVQSVWTQERGLLVSADHVRLLNMLSKNRRNA